MIIYPAIDLKGGRCVRLQQGDFAAETVFAEDPVQMALRWVSEGASWLHVVNLDGALGLEGVRNLDALRRILAAVQVPVQFGGGVRSAEDVDRLLGDGVARVILGTVAVRNPEVVHACVCSAMAWTASSSASMPAMVVWPFTVGPIHRPSQRWTWPGRWRR